MNNKIIDIKKLFLLKKPNYRNLKILRHYSLPTDKNLNYLKNFSEKKKIEIIKNLQIIHSNQNYKRIFWNEILEFWLTNHNDFFSLYFTNF